MNNEGVSNIPRTSVKISWNHGGKQVAIIGSWDNWETREMLQSLGKEFVIIKTLPSGIYHYRFMVDGWLTCAPDLPWVCDDSGHSYNVLDLMTPVSELPESLSEFEFPPSPPSSYDNQCFNDDDFSRPPPDLPPPLRETILNEPSCCTSGHQSDVQPRHTELNHLYQNNVGGEFMALGSTFRFCEKYVTMLLFKPLLKRN
ncbi:SNF1-related protein kinase regulatory subunit beta-2-like [Cucurbita moschata]|uniref:SNF1-related protein kinase regulatory subunit beta-2-like n=1 Tax=Cucurbita moschata TaxID=3662 RepID=A0A6J1FXH3_CUCMO|nr:SNF1-related protein kinase regulatory subunit beta-2-like [Cucurbita moschata]XP_022943900.1 SNF1-related protein kinase regulatory subunit beta-2-like [Cucurbita moschata]XP_022943901.1 SNF1-related protein kinase regulatory subunit beta-2-like [Cucurbita moschata]XP_022943902.1 SNF1-related protein kinase regulatory subunit beta-2-like [Cucurbita moschata]XP_022943903.1 SNF1-related protein kinase regulatory subunit beta-2-like [Cucurbita moschata]